VPERVSQEIEDIIISLVEEGLPYKEVAERVGRSASLVHKVVRRRKRELLRHSKWSIGTYVYALLLRSRGFTIEKIARSVGVHPERLQEFFDNKDVKDALDLLEKEREANRRGIFEELDDWLRRSAQKLARPRVVKKKEIPEKKKRKPEVAMLEFSDSHAGMVLDPRDTPTQTKYNWDLFVKRLETLTDGIIECVSIQREQIPIKKLAVNMLGDIVAGENIYLGQYRELDRNVLDQVFGTVVVLCNKFIEPLREFFETIEFRCVWGNHGRFGKTDEFHPRVNADYLLYKILASRYVDSPDVKFYVSETNCMLFELPEFPKWKHLILHGDELTSWMSIPYYALERAHARYVHLLRMVVDYLHCGHHHSSATISVAYGERIVNGSFVGGTPYSIKKMQAGAVPKQLLFGLNETYGKTWQYEIRLEKPETMKPDSEGIYTPYTGKQKL